MWENKDLYHLGCIQPDYLYFLLNDEGLAIGAVFDMNQDLHWYVVPTHRKIGYLTCALLKSILPHLAIVKKRKTQRITITKSEIGKENYQASLKVARNCRFRIQGGLNDKTVCSQGLLKYKKSTLNIRKIGMDIDELVELRKEMNVVAGKLLQIQTKVELQFGDRFNSHKLLKMSKTAERYQIDWLFEIYSEFKDNNPR